MIVNRRVIRKGQTEKLNRDERKQNKGTRDKSQNMNR